MSTDSPDRLGRHAKRSRVIWHPGSTPPYSSLWITVQRFLMLNQPTRAAFTQDFLVNKPGRIRMTPKDYLVGRDHCPIRLARFARVLKEPLETFRCCHVSQFSPAVRPYFGDFALCPACLREGFHSVLFSFAGLRECPVHHTKLWCRAFDKGIPSPCIFNELAHPYLRCGWDQYELPYAVARAPKANTDRDLAFGEIADWLMAIGVRYWVSPPNLAAKEVPLEDFTQRVVRLKGTLGLPAAIPSWVAARGPLAVDSATVEIAKFGTMKVHEHCLGVNHNKWAHNQNADLNLYYKTLFCDFKAICRYLKHRVLGRGQHWLARLAHAADEAEIGTLLHSGGARAQGAWALLLWWRQNCLRDFNAKGGLTAKPFQLALDPSIPARLDDPRRRPSCPADWDTAHMWLVRRISAAGLLAFWRSIHALTTDERVCAVALTSAQIWQAHSDPAWSLGISADNVLTLCMDRSNDLPAALVHTETLL